MDISTDWFLELEDFGFMSRMCYLDNFLIQKWAVVW